MTSEWSVVSPERGERTVFIYTANRFCRVNTCARSFAPVPCRALPRSFSWITMRLALALLVLLCLTEAQQRQFTTRVQTSRGTVRGFRVDYGESARKMTWSYRQASRVRSKSAVLWSRRYLHGNSLCTATSWTTAIPGWFLLWNFENARIVELKDGISMWISAASPHLSVPRRSGRAGFQVWGNFMI